MWVQLSSIASVLTWTLMISELTRKTQTHENIDFQGMHCIPGLALQA